MGEATQRDLLEENHSLAVKNQEYLTKMKSLVDASGMSKDEVIRIVGCELDDLRGSDKPLHLQEEQEGEGELPGELPGKRVKTVHVKTEYDGLSTYGQDVQSY